uniref:Uncharacterized protein n=1 Tax=Hymenobacter cellulosilyticus TaxID=2932248 RepID=A0A8T9QAM9_9BACT|nr:hypothetical protein [Hymenobacter cellulosilyticus]UOQ73198.1 hypothetical protein MUN79_04295 [Hymenobacter cellulosilyticus]
MQSETDRLIYLLYDKYQGNPEGAAQYVDMALSFGPIEAVTSLSNRNKTFAGSANMSGFVHGNRVIIVVADTKSLYSLLGHSTHRLDHFRSPRWYSYGFTYQFYVWSVRMHTHSWYMARRKTVDRHGRKKDWFGINPSLLPG